MSSRHREPGITVRPPAHIASKAKGQLDARDLEMTAFIGACLNALNAAPDAFLTSLADHWPPAKPLGRPPKKTPQDT